MGRILEKEGEKMIRIKHMKGQSTVEYAIILGVVVAGLIAMQTYVKRGLQARYHDATKYLANQSVLTGMNTTEQYEPYYLDSDYTATQNKSGRDVVAERGNTSRTILTEERTRAVQGYELQFNTTNSD